MGILRNFLYLDEPQLNQYISQVEDGLRSRADRSLATDRDKKAEVDAKIAKFAIGKKRVESELASYDDNGPARFDRLLSLIEGFEEDFGWIDLEDDPDGISGAKPGHVLEFAAEIYESDVTRLSSSTGIVSMLPLMKAIGQMSGSPVAGLDQFDDNTLEALGAFGTAMGGSSVFIGDVIDTQWRFVAPIAAERDVEGTAYVVGKVTRTWGEGAWRPLPGLPVISQLPREQRREYERKGPDEASKMMWLEGPAVQLEILAIYR